MATISHIHPRTPSGKMPDTLPIAGNDDRSMRTPSAHGSGDTIRRTRSETVVLAGVATLLAGVAFLGLKATQDADHNRYNSAEKEALKNATSGWNSIVALKEGVALRTAPVMVNDNGADRNDTVSGRVKKGKVMTLVSPRVYEARDTHLANGVTVADTTTWLAFTKNGTAPASDTPKNDIYWANYSELVRQEDNDHRYVEVYNYPDPNTRNTSSEGNKSLKAGEISVTAFEKMVEQEHLTQNLQQ